MDTPRAEVIAIGDELTSGARLDTNSRWISQRLSELGVAVLAHTTVGDDLDTMVDAFRAAMARAEVVIVTGGLGPTEDDLTRQALAAAAGRPLVLDAPSLAAIQEWFARRGRKMAESNRRQAMLPEDCRPIDNPHGTAPGVAMQVSQPSGQPCHLIALPGVPAELYEMWSASVAGMLEDLLPARRVIRHRCIQCFGVGESRLEEMLPNLIARDRSPRVGITVHQGTISLRITATAADEATCQRHIESTVATIDQCLGTLVFGEGDEQLEHAVFKLLDSRQATVAAVEWGTAGQVALWLAEAAGHWPRNRGGCVVPSLAAANALLDRAGIDLPRDAPLDQRLIGLCRAGQHQFGADYILVTGPLPASGTDRFSAALATPDGITVRSFPAVPHPSLRRVLPAKQALNLLRLALLGET